MIDENLFSERINWKASNKYWVDPETNFIWKSVQSISPKLPPLEIMITKKPAIKRVFFIVFNGYWFTLVTVFVAVEVEVGVAGTVSVTT